MTNPLVSVIIPYYKAGKYIEAAIESVRAQHYAPLEIILIDDGSHDDIASRIKGWGDDIVFVQQENKGPASARNRGVERAKGEILAFLDADDIWTENKLKRQVERLQQDEKLGMVTGRVKWVVLEGSDDRGLIFTKEGPRMNVHLGAALVRKWVFDQVGLFYEKLRFHEDHDFLLRVREAGIGLAIMKDVTLIYQLHNTNMTRDLNLAKTGFMEMLKRSIERRRVMHNGKIVSLPPLSLYFDELEPD